MRTSYWLARCRSHDIVIVGALLIAGWKYTSGIRGTLDIALWDETIYLTQGIGFLHFALPPPGGAPLYSIWYSLLARASSDSIALYYLNCRMVTILPLSCSIYYCAGTAFLYLLLLSRHSFFC